MNLCFVIKFSFKLDNYITEMQFSVELKVGKACYVHKYNVGLSKFAQFNHEFNN